MISKFSVKKPYTVIVAVIMVILLGVISFTKTTTDLLPEMELPYVVVYASYPGASAEKVETEVTSVIEGAIGTTENLLNINSVSSDNLSLIILEFAEDTNMDTATIELSTKLNQASSMLDDMVSTPSLMVINPNLMPVMSVTVDYENKDILELSEFVNKNIINEIEKTAGVATVQVDGLLKETIQIVLDQDKINNINNRILRSVNAELADAEKELLDGLKEVNDNLDKLKKGEKELANTKGETFEQMTQMGIQLNEAANNLIAMEAQITQLNAEKMAFSQMVKAIDDYKTSIGIPEATQADVLSAIDVTLTSIDSGIGALSSLDDSVDLGVVKGTILAIGGAQLDQDTLDYINSATSYNELSVIVDTLLNNLNTTKAQIMQLKELASKYDANKIKLSQLDIEIETAKAIKKTAEDMLKQAGIDTTKLSDLQVQIESGKLLANNEITKGEITTANIKQTLENAKTQLEDGLEQLKDAKEEALKQAKIDSYLNSSMIATILMAENFDMPAGYIASDDASLLVKVGDEFASIDEVTNLLLMSMDIEGLKEIRLSDVATIEIINNEDEIYTKVNGNNAVMMSIQKTSTSSTTEVSKNIKKTFERLETEYPNLHFTALFDQGVYIDMIINSVLQNFGFGAILAVIVLIVFLKDLKPTLIIALSIPFSFLFAIVLMYFSGVTINIISLSGLALGVGMLVDNSVVVVENIYRLRNEGLSYIEASIEGAKQVTSAIIASTLTTICVFLPIVFAEGITKQLFVDMGLTIAYSLIASLVVALTLVPMLSSKMLKNTKEKKHPLFDKIINLYVRSLKTALKYRVVVLVIVFVLFVTSVFMATQRGMELIPEMDSNQITLNVSILDEEATDEEKQATYDEIMDRVEVLEGVEAIGISISNGGMLTALGGESDSISFNVLATLDADIDYLKEAIPDVIKDLPIESTLSANQMDLSVLGGSGISIQVYADDLDDLKACAKELETKLLEIDGIKEVDNGIGEPQDEIRVVVNKNKAMEYGLTVAQVYQTVASKLSTETAGVDLTLDNKVYPTKIISDGVEDVSELGDIILTGTKDQKSVDVKLEKIADIVNDYGMTSINRSNSRRYLTVSASIEDGYNVALVSRDVESKIGEDYFGKKATLEFAGENETIVEAMTSLLQMIALAIAFIYMIMVAQFQSLKSPFIVMFTIPLAFTGGLLSLFMLGQNISIISMLGFLVLSGVVVNNGIVLIDYVNQLREEGIDNYESLLIAGKTRMRPILMTALTTILSMTTMAMGIGTGAEMMQGMAIVTIGGLTYATLLTLYIVPILISLSDKKVKQNVEQ